MITNLSPSLRRALATLLFLGATVLRVEGEVKIEKDAQPANPGILCYTVTSDYQKGPNKLEVLVPDKFEPGKKYPVIYTLPVNVGTTGNWGSGIVELQKLNVHNRYGVIIVAPAYDIDPWFGDMPKPEDPAKPWIRQQGYILEVVIPFVDKEFPTMAERDGRYLVSFSKSGLGGLGLLLRNPDVFSKTAVYDCADPIPATEIFNTWGLVASYGSLANFDQNFNIIRLLRTDKVAKAVQGSSRRVILMTGGLQYGGVNLIHQTLQDTKVPYAYLAFPGMGHSWNAGWLSMAVHALLPSPVKP